jgi:simple sugar transport system ATP-binding protein
MTKSSRILLLMQITIQNLTKSFGPVRANDGITIEFAAGQIHGVLGENGAGKSTLMKLLSGFLRRDSGTVAVGGRPVALRTCGEALEAGIGMVHQEPLDVPAFSVLDNFYTASPRRALPNKQAARRVLLQLSTQLGFPIDPDDPLASLTVGQRQQLEILRLLACGARVLILDEPTTGISAEQARRLFAALRLLAAEGKTVLFVSHKIEEIQELCNTISVLRAGRLVEAQAPLPQPTDRLLHLMFGPLPPPEPPAAAVTPGAPFWELQQVTLRGGALALYDLSLGLRSGQTIGLAGLEGSGQHLLLRLLGGQLRPSSGRLLVDGTDLTTVSQAAFLKAGIQSLPADRLSDGMIGPMTLTEHAALAHGKGGLVDWHAAAGKARQAIGDFNIKATPRSPIATLSGGNQQRAMLALLPPVCRGLLLEQPTRGLDVVSAHSIWERLKQRQAAGTAIVFASADLDELLAYSDYVLVFFGGRVSQLLPRAELDSHRLAELIGGVGFDQVMDQSSDGRIATPPAR